MRTPPGTRRESFPITVRRRIGRCDLVRFFDAEVERRGLRAAVERYLPRVASGWPKNAYHALIGAPEFVPLEVPQSVPPLTWDAATESDEHRVKLAYTCRAHAQAFGDPSYAWVVRAYLEG